MNLVLEYTNVSARSFEMNKLKDKYVLGQSFFNKNYLIESKAELNLESGFVFKTRKVYSKNQLKKLELVKKSTINMSSDLSDSLGYYLETDYELFAIIANGKRIKISTSDSISEVEAIAQKVADVMECRVYHVTNVRCR